MSSTRVDILVDRVWDRYGCESVGGDADLFCFDLRTFPAPPRPLMRGELSAFSRLRCCTNSFSAARAARVCGSDMCRLDALDDVVFPAPPLPVVKIYDNQGLMESSPGKKIYADLIVLGQ